ncbi:MAG: phage holin family protein [Cytophagales bacterium]|nr:phage holin family protein [Cytophagales bacterium]
MGLKNSLSDLLKIGEIKDNVIGLIEAKFELKKLEIQEKAERAVADLIYRFIFLIVATFSMVFMLILIAWSVNQWLGEPWGYVIILAIMLLILLFFHLKRDEVKEQIKEVIQKEMDAMDS